jgi:hypothetical protein
MNNKMRGLESFDKLIPSNTKMVETEIEFRSKLFSKHLTDTLQSVSNEPSLGFYRIEEHIHKSIQSVSDKVNELSQLNEKLKGTRFDLEYSIDTVNRLKNSDKNFDSIEVLLRQSIENANKLKKSSLNSSLQPSQQVTSPKEERKMSRSTSISTVINGQSDIQRGPQRSQTLLNVFLSQKKTQAPNET